MAPQDVRPGASLACATAGAAVLTPGGGRDAGGVKRCFPPVVDAHTRLLILGSLPGERSLAQNQYYAHRQNRFWTLLGFALGADLAALDYACRLEFLLSRGVGLWDVVAEARREGSLDCRIRAASGNELAAFVRSLPELSAIAFNGATAARLGMKQLGPLGSAYRIVNLPSSSPAHARPLAEKRVAWDAIASLLVR
ncbi:DNA-deoxyinosine glycosylase [Paludibacterium yongneupense]|uniref:DNA-deoxyinosine glycosylase n=1 Tax=Paludibacterium yongneupense TaxID=400061 RepID=UPI000A00B8C7|nr:DNA-deoxyinosine glycosylase [Paludibacterium yongneupense]